MSCSNSHSSKSKPCGIQRAMRLLQAHRETPALPRAQRLERCGDQAVLVPAAVPAERNATGHRRAAAAVQGLFDLEREAHAVRQLPRQLSDDAGDDDVLALERGGQGIGQPQAGAQAGDGEQRARQARAATPAHVRANPASPAPTGRWPVPATPRMRQVTTGLPAASATRPRRCRPARTQPRAAPTLLGLPWCSVGSPRSINSRTTTP